jgi:hypothetical protein
MRHGGDRDRHLRKRKLRRPRRGSGAVPVKRPYPALPEFHAPNAARPKPPPPREGIPLTSARRGIPPSGSPARKASAPDPPGRRQLPTRPEGVISRPVRKASAPERIRPEPGIRPGPQFSFRTLHPPFLPARPHVPASSGHMISQGGGHVPPASGVNLHFIHFLWKELRPGHPFRGFPPPPPGGCPLP